MICDSVVAWSREGLSRFSTVRVNFEAGRMHYFDPLFWSEAFAVSPIDPSVLIVKGMFYRRAFAIIIKNCYAECVGNVPHDEILLASNNSYVKNYDTNFR
jgi:hypothetical protein